MTHLQQVYASDLEMLYPDILISKVQSLFYWFFFQIEYD